MEPIFLVAHNLVCTVVTVLYNSYPLDGIGKKLLLVFGLYDSRNVFFARLQLYLYQFIRGSFASHGAESLRELFPFLFLLSLIERFTSLILATQ